MVKEVVFKRLEAAVEVVKQDVPVKVEASVVEVVEEVLSEEVEAALVEVVKEEVEANRRLLLMWPRTLFRRLLRLMWPRQSTNTSSALELSRRRARRGRRATGGSGLRQESGRVW